MLNLAKLSICIIMISIVAYIFMFPSPSRSNIKDREYFSPPEKITNDSCDIKIDQYTNEIKKSPNNSENYYRRGNCFFDKKEYDKAIIDYSKAISLSEKKEYLYNRAITVIRLLFKGGNLDKSLAKSAIADLLKVSREDPDFENNYVGKYIKELNKVILKEDIERTVEYEKLSGSLYAFYLKSGTTLYIIFPQLLSSATFNVFKQHPSAEGDNSSDFLLFRGTYEKFLESLVSNVDIVQKEDKLFIMTIDDHKRQGVQEGLLYGTDICNLHNPDPHYLWVPEPINRECEATGWLHISVTKQNDNLPENFVLHDGTLKIRVLNNNKPVKIIESAISCSKVQGNVPYDDGVYEFVAKIIPACEVTYVNVKLALENDTRWLLDRSRKPNKMMLNYFLEINGKIFPNKYEYIVENEEDNTINFVVKLKRVTK